MRNDRLFAFCPIAAAFVTIANNHLRLDIIALGLGNWKDTKQLEHIAENIDTLAGSIFPPQQGGGSRGGSRTVLLRPTPLSEKIDPVHMDEALARVRGVSS